MSFTQRNGDLISHLGSRFQLRIDFWDHQLMLIFRKSSLCHLYIHLSEQGIIRSGNVDIVSRPVVIQHFLKALIRKDTYQLRVRIFGDKMADLCRHIIELVMIISYAKLIILDHRCTKGGSHSHHRTDQSRGKHDTDDGDYGAPPVPAEIALRKILYNIH